VHYDQILLFDELGDVEHPGPHLLIDYSESGDPFVKGWGYEYMTSHDGYQSRSDPGKRISYFPKPVPDVREEYFASLSFKHKD
jgi:hypothetical protein